MKQSLYVAILLQAMLISSCRYFESSDKEEAIKKITDIEQKLYADFAQMPNQSTATQAILAYIDFSKRFPDDKKSAEYLFKAAEVSMGIAKSHQAISYLKKLCSDYPDYNKAATALFLQAFIYETQIKDNAVSNKLYTEFLEKYPNHSLAKDAKFSLQNLGKSDEEIIKEFEKKMAKDL